MKDKKKGLISKKKKKRSSFVWLDVLCHFQAEKQVLTFFLFFGEHSPDFLPGLTIAYPISNCSVSLKQKAGFSMKKAGQGLKKRDVW